MILIAIVAGVVLARTHFGQQIYATGGNRRAADYAGINTARVRFISFVFAALCASLAGIIYIAFFRSFNRSEEHTSELQSLMRISYAVFCLKKKTKLRQ